MNRYAFGALIMLLCSMESPPQKDKPMGEGCPRPHPTQIYERQPFSQRKRLPFVFAVPGILKPLSYPWNFLRKYAGAQLQAWQ